MRPWRRELMRWARRPAADRRRPVRTGRGLAIHPFVLTLSVALLVAASIIALLEAKLRP